MSNKLASKSDSWFKQYKAAIMVVGVIVSAAILIGLTSGKPSTTASSSQDSKASATSPKRQVVGTSVTIGAGSFVGGKDVAAGLYDVMPGQGQSGNFYVSGSDSYNDILASNPSGAQVSKIRVKISSGDNIDISDLSAVTFTPVTAAYITNYAATSLYSGTFTVGEDIGAGRYIVAPGEGQSGNFYVSGANSYNDVLGTDSSYGQVPSLIVNLSNGDNISISGLDTVTFTPAK